MTYLSIPKTPLPRKISSCTQRLLWNLYFSYFLLYPQQRKLLECYRNKAYSLILDYVSFLSLYLTYIVSEYWLPCETYLRGLFPKHKFYHKCKENIVEEENGRDTTKWMRDGMKWLDVISSGLGKADWKRWHGSIKDRLFWETQTQ